MESLRIAFLVVAPLMVYMTVGQLIRRSGICSTENFKALNQVLFRVFIPLYLFFNIQRAKIGDILPLRLVLLIEGLLIGALPVSWVLLSRFVPGVKDRATIVQGIFRSNFVLFGTLVAESLCDQRGMQLVAALAAVVVPTVNTEGVVLFELIRDGKVSPGKLLFRILKNPLVFAGILGILFNLLGWSLPAFLAEPLMKLGSASTPVALVTLGAILSFGSIRRHLRYLRMAVSGKLIFLPLAAVLTGMLFGYRGNEIVAILAVFASPAAVASAPMAQAMGGNGELAGEIVAISSVACLVTLFAFVFILSSAGII